MMEASELREQTADELMRKLEDAEKEVFFLRARVTGQQPNPAKLRSLRRDIARLKTVLSEKGVRA